jgi:hypothetical protein
MEVQFFVSVVLMSISALAILLATRLRQEDWQINAAMNCLVLLVGGAGLQWFREWSGLAVVGTFVALVVTPAILQSTVNRQSLGGGLVAGAVSSRLLILLRPSAWTRFYVAQLDALANRSVEQKVKALHALAGHATPEQRAWLDIKVAASEDDWEAVLARFQKLEGRARRRLSPFAIRACGELGRLEEMVQVFSEMRPRLMGLDLQTCCLFILAFAGRPQSLGRLISKKLRSLKTKDYWMAIAAKASAANDENWRRAMATFAGTTDDETSRRAAERHLAEVAAPPSQQLSPEAIVTLEAAEKRLFSKGTPVATLLLMLSIAGFAVEISYGGSDNMSNLFELGALSPPLVLRGGWWRLITTLFLSYTYLHFLTPFQLRTATAMHRRHGGA